MLLKRICFQTSAHLFGTLGQGVNACWLNIGYHKFCGSPKRVSMLLQDPPQLPLEGALILIWVIS